MIEKPKSAFRSKISGAFIDSLPAYLRENEWEEVCMFTAEELESQLKAERERVIRECIKIGFKHAYDELEAFKMEESMLKLLDN
jgi:hypothetical protein